MATRPLTYSNCPRARAIFAGDEGEVSILIDRNSQREKRAQPISLHYPTCMNSCLRVSFGRCLPPTLQKHPLIHLAVCISHKLDLRIDDRSKELVLGLGVDGKIGTK